MARMAASSTLSQLANLFSSVRIRAMTLRLYRGIMLHLAKVCLEKVPVGAVREPPLQRLFKVYTCVEGP